VIEPERAPTETASELNSVFIGLFSIVPQCPRKNPIRKVHLLAIFLFNESRNATKKNEPATRLIDFLSSFRFRYGVRCTLKNIMVGPA
jgi:hypothetical protein